MCLHCIVHYFHISSIRVSVAGTLFTSLCIVKLACIPSLMYSVPSPGCQEYHETETRYVGPRTHTHTSSQHVVLLFLTYLNKLREKHMNILHVRDPLGPNFMREKKKNDWERQILIQNCTLSVTEKKDKERPIL